MITEKSNCDEVAEWISESFISEVRRQFNITKLKLDLKDYQIIIQRGTKEYNKGLIL